MEEGITLPDVSIPLIKGDTGNAGKITSLQITMLASTATPTVTNNGTESEAQYVLGIPKGTGISNASINDSGELVLTLTDTTTINVGTVVGTSVSAVYFDDEYNLIMVLSDDNEINVGNLETEMTSIINDALADYYDKDTCDSMFALIDETGNKIDLSLNTTTYVMTLTLKDKNNNTLSTGTVDLPLESVVVSGSYDSVSKKIVLTLQSGSTVEFSVADLVSGLQTEITSSNKLSADLVTDTNTTNKFVTSTEKTKIANAVTSTDYATGSTGGVVKSGNLFKLRDDGVAECAVKSYAEYGSSSNTNFISKGTLENVITGKGLTTKSYVDGLVGDVETALEALDTGGGVE